jgi:hypothetical protein
MAVFQLISFGVSLDRIGETKTTTYKPSLAIITLLFLIWTGVTIYLEMSK